MTYIDIDVNGLKSLINHLYKDNNALGGNRTLEAFVKNAKLDLAGWTSDIHLAYHNDLPMTNWYRTFAWLPTETMDRGLVWMCHIWKRRVKHRNLIGQATYYTQYLMVDPYADAVDINTLYPLTSGVTSKNEMRDAPREIAKVTKTPYSPYYGINYKSDPFDEEKS